MQGDFRNPNLDSVEFVVPVTNGKVNFGDQSALFLESGIALTNWTLQNVADQVYGVDVVVETLGNPEVIKIKAFILNVQKYVQANSRYCVFTETQNYDVAAETLKRIYNTCVVQQEVATVLGVKRKLFNLQTTPQFFSHVNNYLFDVANPGNNGHFKVDASNRPALDAERWNEYRLGLNKLIDENRPQLELSPFNDKWTALVSDMKQGTYKTGNNNHECTITYVRVAQ